MSLLRSFLPALATATVLLVGGVAWGWAGASGPAPAEGSIDPGVAGGGLPDSSPFAWLLPPAHTPVLSTSTSTVGAAGTLAAQVPRSGGVQDAPRECMPWQASGPPREFHFTRGIYSAGGGGGFFGRRGGRAWCTDHPKAEEQFLEVLDRLTGIDAHQYGNAVHLDDPELRRYPVLYMLEVGYMGMTQSEVEGLRSYLLAGGFLIIDDFWGSREWFNFEREMARVLPEYPIVELPMEHPAYRAYYQVDTVLQVPAVRWSGDYSRTWEQDGFHARNFGIFHEDGRLMVAINWNTDLGDAWEWMEQPHYPLRLSTYAYQVGVNYIVYAMSN